MARQKSFARFLVTRENRAAFLAVNDLATSLQQEKIPLAQPLFLHGPPGSGKSHLVDALAGELSRRETRVLAQVMAASEVRETGTAPPLDADLLDADLLAIEDLQHFPVKAEEWLVNLLDERQRRGLATVVTAATGPRHLANKGNRFSARLTSRLAGGLVVALEPLQAASRLLFLAELAQRRQLAVRPEILQWLAAHLTGGGRQLEGAISQLESLNKLRGSGLDLASVTAHFGPDVDAIRPSVERIARQVGGYFRVRPEQLQSRRRYRNILLPRQVGMYLARALTKLSLEQIGAYFGGRDHSTVLHACRKVANAIEGDAVLSGAVRQLHAELA